MKRIDSGSTDSPNFAVIGRLPALRAKKRRLYTVAELMRLTGLTRKQVAYWAKTKLLAPTLRDPKAPTGRPASFYAQAGVIRALILCDLRRAGFSPRQVKQVAAHLDDIRLDYDRSYILTDGYSVYHAQSDSEVVDIHKHYRQMLLLVLVNEQVKKLGQVA